MTGRYQEYSEYKNSNLEWLGSIPQHWEIRYSKWLFSERNTKATKNDEMLTASQKYGVIPQKEFMRLEQQKVVQVQTGYEILKSVKKNDFVISMRSFQGGIEFCSYDGSVSSAYVPLTPSDEVDLGYFKYLFKSKQYIQALQSTTNLVRDGQALRYSNFVQVKLPLPEKIEQACIANFLDYETAKIDQLITKQEKLIELLKEKRQAVISHAVTKGLNSAAKVKDSGVEWLGKVPETWNVMKFGITIKSAILGGNYTSSEAGDGVPLIKMGNLGRGKISLKKIEYLSKDEKIEKCFILRNGDFLFNTRNSMELVGKVSIWRDELNNAVYNSNILKIAFDDKFVSSSQYMSFLFNSDLGLSQLRLIAKGTTSVAAIYYKELKSLIFALPPLDEQIHIVNKLKEDIRKLDDLIQASEKAIALIKERKTALISAAVTGKIDVKNWQG